MTELDLKNETPTFGNVLLAVVSSEKEPENCLKEWNKEKIWSEPKMSDFDNKMFSDTHVIDYNSYRLIDNQKSSDFTLYFNFKDFTYHYTVDYEKDKNQKSRGNRLKLESIKFLIYKGYDVPLYNNA